MIAVIDIGNARLKWALAESGRLSAAGVAVPLDAAGDACAAVIEALPETVEAICVSNVAGPKIAARLSEAARARFGFEPRYLTTQARHLDLRCAYREPAAFGVDRWLALIGAYHLAERPYCVIDAGTAVTFDAVDASGRHLGGLILASPALIGRALSAATNGIAAAAENPARPAGLELLADSTAGAVGHGAWLSVAAALDRAAAVVAAELGAAPRVLLTGGGAPILESWLETACEHRPDLVLEGLVFAASPEN